MVLVKNVKSHDPFFLAKTGLKKVFSTVLERNHAFLDFKNISFMKVAKLTFFQKG